MTREELDEIEERHGERENGAGLSFGRTAKGTPWREPGTSGLVEAHEDRGALLAEVRRLREVIRNADEELDGVYSDASGAVDCAQRTLRDGLR